MKELLILIASIQAEFKSDVEFVGVITNDNRLIVLGHGDFNSARMQKPILFNGAYYVRIVDNQKYEGQINNRLGKFVPIKATIHSHNPNCSGLGDLGVISDSDLELSSKINTKHFIIGCGAFAEFNSNGYVRKSKEIEAEWIL